MLHPHLVGWVTETHILRHFQVILQGLLEDVQILTLATCILNGYEQ